MPTEETLQGSNEQQENHLPKGFFVDEGTGKRLEELCREMTNSCGQIGAILQLELEIGGEKRTKFMQTALDLSSDAIRSVKMFLSEWNVLMAESKIENARRVAPVILRKEIISLAEAQRRAVMHAMQEAKGNKDAASRLLRITKATLVRKLKVYKVYACDPLTGSQEHQEQQEACNWSGSNRV